ncbi:MAG: ribose-phosphate diphosphokinase [Patescibacteria group bacterium]|nr:ribose-phosphate diphosphokinase [Patescibacteria group bacterium]
MSPKASNCKSIRLITGTSHIQQTQRIAHELSKKIGYAVKLVPTLIVPFKNGELHVQVLENVRGCDVFAIQSLHYKYNYSLLEEYELLIDCIRDSAKRITGVFPWLCYTKQDRKTIPRESRSLRVAANRINQSRTHRVLLFDIHNSATADFFKINDRVYLMKLLIQELKKRKPRDVVLCSPDIGSAKRVEAISKLTGIKDICIVQKIHDHEKKCIDKEKSRVLGDVKGKNVWIFDDMIQSFGTMSTALDILEMHGAKSITVAAVHPDFTPEAITNIKNSCADEVIVVDTIPFDNIIPNKITVIDPSEFIAECIFRIHTERSLSKLFMKF